MKVFPFVPVPREMRLHVDGSLIPYDILTAADYLCKKEGMAQKDIERFQDQDPYLYEMLTQILSLKAACFVFRHTSHVCGSMADALFSLKCRLIEELKGKGIDFDDDFVEEHAKTSWLKKHPDMNENMFYNL